jgi:hypothetical protein
MADTNDTVELVAQRAVEGVLQRLGIDTSNPIQAQADFQRLRAFRKMLEDEEFQADLVFMRRWRVNSEKITDTGMRTFVRVAVSGALGLLLLGTKDWWIKHITG